MHFQRFLLLSTGLAGSAHAASRLPTPYPTPTYGGPSSTSTTAPPTCAALSTPTFAYSTFTYTPQTSTRYATPISSPVSYSTPFAPAFSRVSTLLPQNLTYTTYSLDPSATTLNDGQYGQSAYNALWVGYSYTETVPFTTTRSPTPVASSELIFPPALYTACPSTDNACLSCYKLPADFVWGVAGSASQIEGGSQSEGRGPSFLDVFGNQDVPPLAGLADFVVADMNYFLYKQDIVRLAAMGVPYYSLSISWSRIVPFATAGSPVNQQAIDHYDDLIKFCLKHGIKPIVTLIHADFPTLSGFTSQAAFRANYLYYAKLVMTRWAAYVPYWVTFNEPNIDIPIIAPDYNILTTFLLAHADVYKWYKTTLNGTGQITLKFANNLAVPLTQNAADTKVALRYQDFIVGIMANPLFLGTQYPSNVLNTVNLTALTRAELTYIHNSIDFLSVDPYVAQFASAPPGGIASCASDPSNALWPSCAVLSNTQADGWLMGDKSNDYAYIAPQYVRQQLGYLWNTFHPAAIMITEFGFNEFAEAQMTLVQERYDLQRTLYYREFLAEMLKSVYEDGVNVIGALAWSFVDNNEFGSYANRYGMQTVNRTSGNFERHYKRSFFDYVDFFQGVVGPA